jgi:hypothetical protein
MLAKAVLVLMVLAQVLVVLEAQEAAVLVVQE